MSRFTRSLGLAAVLVAVAAGGTATHASGLPTFSMTPLSGPVGTVVTATSGTPCPAPRWGRTEWARVDLWGRPTRVSGFGENATDPTLVAYGIGPVDRNGTWSASLTVPAGTHTGLYAVEVKCWATNRYGGYEPYQDYADLQFRVTN